MWASSSSSYSILANDSDNGNPRLSKTMEEVWKDISLSCLNSHHNHHAPAASSRGIILQDFFSRDPKRIVAATASPAPPPPGTLLTLSSAEDQLNHLVQQGRRNKPTSEECRPRPDMPVEAPVSNPDGKKSTSQNPDNICGDRRRKRMIKNRESAARSRARKQAYTNELELEVAHLLRENAMLKKQMYLVEDDDDDQHSKKKRLCRASTAPF